jgi:hypothetical protein
LSQCGDSDAAHYRELLHAAAKDWGSIERAKKMIRRLEEQNKQREADTRSRAQAKERLPRLLLIAMIIYMLLLM